MPTATPGTSNFAMAASTTFPNVARSELDFIPLTLGVSPRAVSCRKGTVLDAEREGWRRPWPWSADLILTPSAVLGELLERHDAVVVGLLGKAEDALADDVVLDLVG